MRIKFLTFIFSLFSLFAFPQKNDYQSVVLPDALLANANAIVRNHEIYITLKAQNLMEVKGKRVVTVLNKKGNSLVQAYLHYDKNESVKNIEVKVLDVLGNETKKIKQKEFKNVSAVPNGTLYSDSRVMYLEYTPVKYPYTVEFTFEYTTSTTAFLPPWQPLDDYWVSVENSIIEITDEVSLTLRTKESNLEYYEGISKQAQANKVTYTAKNLKALKEEDYSPPLYEYAPRVLFALNKFHLEGVNGEATNWEEFGKWQYDKLLTNRDILSQQTHYEALKLVDGVTDPIEKAKLIYEYVQNSTRYISVQVGIGGWMPIDAATVDKVKYGDCKGLTNYTKALLKAVGVEAYYAVVYAGNQKRGLEVDFASMQGNHVILNIPTENGDTWLECTSQITPFGFLGDFTDEREVLLLTPNGGMIKKTAVYPPQENTMQSKAVVQVNADGSLNGTVVINTQNIQYDKRFFLERFTQEEVIKFYKEEYWDYLNNLTINKYSFNNNKEKVSFNENVEFTIHGYVSFSGERMILMPNMLNRFSSVPDRYRERQSPVKINRGYFDEDEFIISLPEGYSIEAIPKDFSLSTKFGNYSFKIIDNQNGTLTYKRKMLLNEGQYPKEEYETFRSFMKEVAAQDQAKIVLIKKTT